MDTRRRVDARRHVDARRRVDMRRRVNDGTSNKVQVRTGCLIHQATAHRSGSNISLLRRSTLAPRRWKSAAMSGVMNWPS